LSAVLTPFFKAMTKNLVVKGNLEKPLILHNRTKLRAVEHSLEIGYSTVANTLEEAVSKSDIIWSCLQDQDAVESTFDEILKDDVKGKLFLESSTVLPELIDQLAKRVMDAGAEFVAMPGLLLSNAAREIV
jgi:3-hydroxyisobutyrate dehydrogenase-like beta-hydroxyacid dehydrogenase